MSFSSLAAEFNDAAALRRIFCILFSVSHHTAWSSACSFGTLYRVSTSKRWKKLSAVFWMEMARKWGKFYIETQPCYWNSRVWMISAEVLKLAALHCCPFYTTYLADYRRHSMWSIRRAKAEVPMTKCMWESADSRIFDPKIRQNSVPSTNVDSFRSPSYTIPSSYDRLYFRLAPNHFKSDTFHTKWKQSIVSPHSKMAYLHPIAYPPPTAFDCMNENEMENILPT